MTRVARFPHATRLGALAVALLLALVIVRACAEGPVPPPDVPGPPVHVLLARDAELRPLDADGTVHLFPDGAPARACEDLGALAFAEGRLHLEGAPLRTTRLVVDPPPGTTLAHGGRRYRGQLVLRVVDGSGPGAPARIEVVNRVALEEYLLGVLPGEMPDRFAEHARMAQAIAARSYALAEMAERGFVHADTRSQVYDGLDGETSAGSRAVRSTEGQVLLHDGGPITAWFHSTCGGQTTPARTVFANAPPTWLAAPVACPDCTHSPVYAWTRRVPVARLAAALGLPFPPRSIATDVDSYPGRARLVVLATPDGPRASPATTLRAALSQGVALGAQLLSTLWTHAPHREGDAFVFRGRGWGHGVGLCQYGADGYARRGANYVAILERYYPEARLDRWPVAPARPVDASP